MKVYKAKRIFPNNFNCHNGDLFFELPDNKGYAHESGVIIKASEIEEESFIFEFVEETEKTIDYFFDVIPK